MLKTITFFCIYVLPFSLFAAEPLFQNFFQEAETEFAKKNYAAAHQLYAVTRDNLRSRNLPKEQFRSLWLTAGEQIVRCLTAMNDNKQAAEEYFLLCRIEPLVSLDAVPLPWFVPLELKTGTKPRETTPENILDPLKTPQAETESPASVLLAAGILSVSNNPLKQQNGKQKLRQIAASLETEPLPKEQDKEQNKLLILRRQEAALLAKVMLWKEQIPLLKTEDDLIPMKHILEKIREPQKIGAYFLLGNAARQIGKKEEAILFWMRIPVLYEYNRPLTIEALLESAAELKILGRSGQAEILLKEAVK